MLNCVVVIPTLNEESKIGELIQSLNDDEYPNKEIIVVDGGSKDKTVEISEKNGAIVILEKVRINHCQWLGTRGQNMR